MLISLDHKLAFLAVPKTGTTAIEAALRKHADIVFRGRPEIKHMNAAQFEAMMRPYLATVGGEGVQTFAIMRHPVDLLQSWYFYRRRLDDARPEKQAQSTRGMTLERFLEARLSDDRPDFAKVGNQGAFLCGRKALREAGGARVKPLVDIVFPYEKMDEALAFLSQRLGETVAVERKNTSQREAAEIAPALRARVEQHLADDMALHARVLAGEFLPGTPHAEARQTAADGTEQPRRKRAAARKGA
ncbi:MAG: gamma-glutamyl kinase [Gemmobacter sp.]